MKKILLTLTILFVVLTFAGAGYVLYTAGNANAGFALIPMLACLICLQGYRAYKK